MIRAELSAEGRRVLALLRSWPQRTRKVRQQLTRLVADMALEDLRSRIPGRSAYRAYRDGLKVSAVEGLSDGEVAYAVHISPKETRLRKVDAQEVLLYVRPRRGRRRVPDAVLVLEQFSPWTAGTIPFKPSRRDARLVSQRVSRRAVGRVAAERRRDRRRWEPLLRKAGVRRIRRDKEEVLPGGLRALPAAALDAVRLEFGLGGGDSKAHWRPMLVALQRKGLRQLVRSNKELRRALLDPSFGGWRSWPSSAPSAIGVGEAAKLMAFQDKLGVRVLV